MVSSILKNKFPSTSGLEEDFDDISEETLLTSAISKATKPHTPTTAVEVASVPRKSALSGASTTLNVNEGLNVSADTSETTNVPDNLTPDEDVENQDKSKSNAVVADPKNPDQKVEPTETKKQVQPKPRQRPNLEDVAQKAAIILEQEIDNESENTEEEDKLRANAVASAKKLVESEVISPESKQRLTVALDKLEEKDSARKVEITGTEEYSQASVQRESQYDTVRKVIIDGDTVSRSKTGASNASTTAHHSHLIADPAYINSARRKLISSCLPVTNWIKETHLVPTSEHEPYGHERHVLARNGQIHDYGTKMDMTGMNKKDNARTAINFARKQNWNAIAVSGNSLYVAQAKELGKKYGVVVIAVDEKIIHSSLEEELKVSSSLTEKAFQTKSPTADAPQKSDTTPQAKDNAATNQTQNMDMSSEDIDKMRPSNQFMKQGM